MKCNLPNSHPHCMMIIFVVLLACLPGVCRLSSTSFVTFKVDLNLFKVINNWHWLVKVTLVFLLFKLWPELLYLVASHFIRDALDCAIGISSHFIWHSHGGPQLAVHLVSLGESFKFPEQTESGFNEIIQNKRNERYKRSLSKGSHLSVYTRTHRTHN